MTSQRFSFDRSSRERNGGADLRRRGIEIKSFPA
jgi:hypothetical protein